MVDYSIIVDCPDEYLDILKIFFIFLERNWPTRTQHIYVTTQLEEIDHPENVEFVKCGLSLNSIQRTKKAIEKVPTDYFLTLGSDCFIGAKVDDNLILNLLGFASENKINYIQVWRTTKNREQRKYPTDFKGLYYCNKKARYSKSLMANFWTKSEYLSIFNSDSDNGWSVEAKWLEEARNEKEGFSESYCFCNSDPFHIVHAVSKGKWIRKAYRYCLRNSIKKDMLSNRKKLPIKVTFKVFISMFIANHFSSSFSLKLKHAFRKKVNFTSKY